MKNLLSIIFIGTMICSAPLTAHSNFCSKCAKLRQYHKDHPSKYTYFEDYKEDVENGKVNVEEEITVEKVMQNN